MKTNRAMDRTGMLQRAKNSTELPIVLFTVMVYTVFALMADNFNTIPNNIIIIQQLAINGIVALGVTIVIMIGGMDLSVGSILSLCGVVGGMLDNSGLPIALVLCLTLLLGMAAGALNGLLITKLGIPDIIVTMATMNIYRGIAVLVSGSRWITDFSDAFKFVGANRSGLMSVPVLLFAVCILAFSFMLNKMSFGRRLYALGGNKQAAMLMGMPVKRVRMQVYVINGFLLGLCGILYASMFTSIQAATAATGLQFQTMSAALIGGSNIFGGSGSVLGTVVGTFMMGIIRSGLVQIYASEYWMSFITGLVILLALLVNVIQERRNRRV